jgi:mannose-6-phosphate isomerase-like protein (cupin superfamily)
MKRFHTSTTLGKFQVLGASRLAQRAMMTLRPGDTSDESLSNEHPRSEQWYVVAGCGSAISALPSERARYCKSKPGSAIQIGRSERHQIRNTGTEALVIRHFYSPPAYSGNGEILQKAK